MRLRNTATQYGAISKILHWAIFLIFVNQFVTAAVMLWMRGGDFRGQLFGWHKALGLLVIMVAVVRIAWRRFTPLPRWAPGMAAWEKASEHFIERSLYVLMILMPFTGLFMSVSGGHGTQFFGLFDIPGLSRPNQVAASIGWFLHRVVSYGIIGLVALHVGFVLRRNIFERDGYLGRMLPWGNGVVE